MKKTSSWIAERLRDALSLIPMQCGWLQCAQTTTSSEEIGDFDLAGKVYADVSEVKKCDVLGEASMPLCVARVA